MDIVKEGINFKRAALNYLKWKGGYEERSCKCEENKPHKCAESKTGWINVKCKLHGGEGRAEINYRRWKGAAGAGGGKTRNKQTEIRWRSQGQPADQVKKIKIFKIFFFFFLKQKSHRMARGEGPAWGRVACRVIMKTKCVFCLVWLLCGSGTILTCGNIHFDVLKVYWLW